MWPDRAASCTFLLGLLAISFAGPAGEARASRGEGEPTAPPAVGGETAGARDDEAAPARGARWDGNVELKRYATDRGTTDETTQTSLRLEAYFEGFVNLLRVDVPFPDAKTDFGGSPFDPRLGDVKIRVRTRAFPRTGLGVTSFLEMTFPTANPPDLGSGKYQLSAGLRYYGRLFPRGTTVFEKKLSHSVQVQQVVSVAGDPDRKEIDNTRFDFGFFYAAGKRTTLKATFKPTIDWVEDGKTGAVLDLEARFQATRAVVAWLKGGTRLWGEGVPGTYGARLEIGVGHRF